MLLFRGYRLQYRKRDLNGECKMQNLTAGCTAQGAKCTAHRTANVKCLPDCF